MRRICQGVAKSKEKSCHRASRGYATCLRWTLLVCGQWFARLLTWHFSQHSRTSPFAYFLADSRSILQGLNTTQSTTRTVKWVKSVTLDWSSRWWGRTTCEKFVGPVRRGVWKRNNVMATKMKLWNEFGLIFIWRIFRWDEPAVSLVNAWKEGGCHEWYDCLVVEKVWHWQIVSKRFPIADCLTAFSKWKFQIRLLIRCVQGARITMSVYDWSTKTQESKSPDWNNAKRLMLRIFFSCSVGIWEMGSCRDFLGCTMS